MGSKVKIGLFGIGLDTYWSQFDGLLDKLKSFQLRIKDRLEQSGTEVFDAGMVDNPDKAIEAEGLSIQMKVANGPVTLLSVCQGGNGRITLLTAQGHSVEGPTLQVGNTNSRYKFPLSAREFIDNWSKAGPSHHCAIGVGHISDKICKLADLLSIEYLSIC